MTVQSLILIVLAQALCALRVIKCGVLGVLHTKVLVVVPRWNGVKGVGGIHGAVFASSDDSSWKARRMVTMSSPDIDGCNCSRPRIARPYLDEAHPALRNAQLRKVEYLPRRGTLPGGASPVQWRSQLDRARSRCLCSHSLYIFQDHNFGA